MTKDGKISLKSLKRDKKSRMLFVFLGLSFLFWMLIKLSKEYTDVIKINVDYTNVPEGKMLIDDRNNLLEISVRTYGFNLIKYHLFKRNVDVDLQMVKKKKGRLHYILSKELLTQVEKQISSEIELININPDTLYFDLGSSKSKKVPIIPDITIEYQPGYNLLGNLDIAPSEIKISGPENLIDSIKEVSTEKIILTDINSDIDIETSLIELDKGYKVNYAESEVVITGKVEKFTEAKLTLPFSIKNRPENIAISTFPSEVELIFKVGISDYNKINKNDFIIVCDYGRSVENGLDYLIPEIISKPEKVSAVKIIPAQIPYLIKK